MSEQYLQYYDRYAWRAVLRFMFDALRSRSRLRRLSLVNRQRDYLKLSQQPELLAPGGLLLFESHAPDYEGTGLNGVLATISDMFAIREQRVLEAGTFLDRGRTFAVAEKTSG